MANKPGTLELLARELALALAVLAAAAPVVCQAAAPMTASGRNRPMRCRLATGAGRTALSREPSGAGIVTGRNDPALFGTSGATTHFTP